MSMQYCYKCDTSVDTDHYPDHFEVDCPGGENLPARVKELIDARHALLGRIESMKQKDAELVNQIAALLLEAGVKQEYGSKGIGYALTSSTRYDYRPGAYRFLEEKGLIEQFRPEPKITKGKLDALVQEGVLTYADRAEIEKYTIVEQSPYSLRKVVDKEAVIK